MQLELFDYRKDYLFKSENQIANYYDILSETIGATEGWGVTNYFIINLKSFMIHSRQTSIDFETVNLRFRGACKNYIYRLSHTDEGYLD